MELRGEKETITEVKNEGSRNHGHGHNEVTIGSLWVCVAGTVARTKTKEP